MLYSREKIIEEFNLIGLTLDENALGFCLGICDRQNVSEGTLVNAWVAYSLTELNDNKAPTVEQLLQFEVKEFGDQINTPGKQKVGPKLTKKDSYGHSPANQKTPKSTIHGVNDDWSSSHPITPTSSRTTPIRHCPTPGGQYTPRRSCEFRNVLNTLAETHSSPNVDQIGQNIQSEEEVGLSGRVLCQHGESLSDSIPSDAQDLELEFQLYNGHLEHWRTMIDILKETSLYSEDYCEDVANFLIEKNNITEPLISFSTPTVEHSYFLGKIICEKGRCDPSNFEMESIGISRPEKIYVDITRAGEYSIFPGQIIIVKGIKANKNKIIASEIFYKAPALNHDIPSLTETLRIMIAAGPFAAYDQPDSKVISNIIEHARTMQPNILFLIGPLFLEIDHAPDSYPNCSESYQQAQEMLIGSITKRFADTNIRVHYITSYKDLCSVPIYPTPVIEGSTYSKISLPDPAYLNFRSLFIGFTTVDVLLHLGQLESSNCRENRIARLCGHLLSQQSFYPIQPNPLDVPVDYGKLFTYSRLHHFPSILILPSELQCFIKEVDGCLFINPQKCLRGQHGNNFAFIEVRPPSEGIIPWSVNTHVSAKICRV